MFYGYPKYEWTKSRLEQYRKPYWLRKLASPYFFYKGGKEDLLQSTQRDYADVYSSLGMFCYNMSGTEKFDRLKFAQEQPYNDFLKNKDRGILAYSDYDMKTFMNAVNMKVDRATMRCSLELRSPIQDYRVAEYSRLLPYEYQYGKYGLKTILKDILYERVPRELLDRPKRGFVPPTADWFRGMRKQEFLDVTNYCTIKALFPELDVKMYLKEKERYLHGKSNNSRMHFSIYAYIKWYDKYIK